MDLGSVPTYEEAVAAFQEIADDLHYPLETALVIFASAAVAAIRSVDPSGALTTFQAQVSEELEALWFPEQHRRNVAAFEAEQAFSEELDEVLDPEV